MNDYTRYSFGMVVAGGPWRIGTCPVCGKRGVVLIHETGMIETMHVSRNDTSPATHDSCQEVKYLLDSPEALDHGLTIGEAAALVGRAPETIYSAINDDRLKARIVEFGKLKLYSIGVLELRRYVLEARPQGWPKGRARGAKVRAGKGDSRRREA